MLVPCEVAVRCALPAIRAMIANELMRNYKLRQKDAAKLLGISQPAISLYSRKIRGQAIDLGNDSDIKSMTAELARRLSGGKLPQTEFISNLCQICKTMRAKGLLCEMHRTFDPSIDIEQCELCKSMKLVGCI